MGIAHVWRRVRTGILLTAPLFVLFVSRVRADVIIPECGPGETPQTHYCVMRVPFYRTEEFMVLVGLLIIAAIAFFGLYRIRRSHAS